jgi:hypothetical protein
VAALWRRSWKRIQKPDSPVSGPTVDSNRNCPWQVGVQKNVEIFHSAAWLVLLFGMQAQIAIVRPEFTARQIGPTGGWLWPGRMFSIYGKYLGPADSCVRDAGPFRPDGPNSAEEIAQVERTLPSALCGVQVLIDEEPVPLIYVDEKQINFVVPGSRKFGNKVMLRVLRGGMSSVPVALKFGPDQMWLYQEQRTSTGMPVWVRLYRLAESKIPIELPFLFPLLGSVECPHIEVKFNGTLLPELKPRTPLRRVHYSGPPCPAPPVPDRQSLAGRIPLHLRFRMDHPGVYFARYVPGSGLPGLPTSTPTTAATDWSPIELNAGSPEQRQKWLAEKTKSIPLDRESIVYDFLPSIFGYGDAEALEVGLKLLYNADQYVANSAAGYLRDYYPASELIPALQHLQQRRGRNQIVQQLLSDIGSNPAER